MRFLKRTLIIPCLGLSWILSSCTGPGSGSGASPFIDSVFASFKENRARLAFEFNNDLSLNLEVLKNIGNFGFIQFAPAAEGQGFRIIADLSTEIFLDKLFTDEIVRFLPNGTPFPTYVNSRLGAYQFAASDKWSGNLYVGVDPGKRLLGASVNLSFIDASFPAGVNITQKITAAQGNHIGSVTFFGPVLNDSGELVKPGGIFVVVNLNDLIGAGQPQAFDVSLRNIAIGVDPAIEIYNPNNIDLSPGVLQNLYFKVLENGRQSGVLN